MLCCNLYIRLIFYLTWALNSKLIGILNVNFCIMLWECMDAWVFIFDKYFADEQYCK